MQKSFIERIFPSPNPMLPTDEHSYSRHSNSPPPSPTPSSSRSSSIPHRPHQPSPLTRQPLQSSHLSPSVVHHADPLLPVDRAARALEKTIQSLLDAQAEGLLTGMGNATQDEASSIGSLTPTPSISTPSRTSLGPKLLPVRQPAQKKITLRGARKGLARSMRDFAVLRDEEIKILETQCEDRDNALKSVQSLEDKRAALELEAAAVQDDDKSSSAKQIRIEAQVLDGKIRALEERLSDMKARHRHMLDQANQLENIVDSKLSSYKSSIGMVDAEIRRFLRRPPVAHGLRDPEVSVGESGMYALKPERRTLEMAKEQWKIEQEMLAQRKEFVENEQRALREGRKLWLSAVERIADFEKTLREQTEELAQSQLQPDTRALLSSLSSLIKSLQADLSVAEANEWNLLICALGAEFEALREGRWILQETLGIPADPDEEGPSQIQMAQEENDDEDHDIPPDDDLIRYHDDVGGGSLGASSNASLEETMKAFHDENIHAPAPASAPAADAMRASTSKIPASYTSTHQRHSSRVSSGAAHSAFGFGPRPRTNPTAADSRSDTEDDDPGPDFFVSNL